LSGGGRWDQGLGGAFCGSGKIQKNVDKPVKTQGRKKKSKIAGKLRERGLTAPKGRGLGRRYLDRHRAVTSPKRETKRLGDTGECGGR